MLKLEQLQCAGSFKTRGALANLLLREIPPAGVIAASEGNHGVAVAYAAHRLGVPATIFVPAIAGRARIDARRYGRQPESAGRRQRCAELAYRRTQDSRPTAGVCLVVGN